MPYTEAVRKAVLRYRQKNRDTIAPKVTEQVKKHRAKWKPYNDEAKRLRLIGAVF